MKEEEFQEQRKNSITFIRKLKHSEKLLMAERKRIRQQTTPKPFLMQVFGKRIKRISRYRNKRKEALRWYIPEEMTSSWWEHGMMSLTWLWIYRKPSEDLQEENYISPPA